VSELNLILLGPPGAGKGTQAVRLREDFGLPYIASGVLLREHRDQGTVLGRKAAEYIDQGELMPDEFVITMIFDKIDRDGEDGFLLDGFPRTMPQALALEEEIARRGRRLTAVLAIDVPDDVVMHRLSGRRQCKNGHLYHIEYDPPKHLGICDQDGTKLFQREDDNPDTVKRRLALYHEETTPLIDHYDSLGLLRRFDGQRTPTEIHDHIRATLATLRLEERL
jgi:adenylate kinase